MAAEDELSIDPNNIQEPKIKGSEEAFDDFIRRSTDLELSRFKVRVQKEVHRQAKWEFWIFQVAFKIVVILVALAFIGFSLYCLKNLFILISTENCVKFATNWHLPIVIIISFVSAIVAVLAILLRGLSRNRISSLAEDVPLPALARAIVELVKAISAKNS